MWNTIWTIILDYVNRLVNVLPTLFTALAVFLVGYILAKSVRKIISTVLSKAGIDKLADKLNEIDLVANTNIDLKPSAFLSGIAYYLVLFVFVMASVEMLGMQAISDLMNDFINYLPKAVSALFVFILGILLSDLVKKTVQTLCESLGIASAKLLANLVFYFLFINVALVTMKQAELQTDFMENNISIILGGIILAFSIGYGLASKSLMSNMLSSYYNKERFRLEDEVTVGGQRGKVIGMDSTTLTLRTTDGEFIVPLSQLSTEPYTIHRKDQFLTLDTDKSANL
jgi:hypothetical protein